MPSRGSDSGAVEFRRGQQRPWLDWLALHTPAVSPQTLKKGTRRLFLASQLWRGFRTGSLASHVPGLQSWESYASSREREGVGWVRVEWTGNGDTGSHDHVH